MAFPHSLDLRERVVAAVAGGMSRKAAADRFQVSHSSAIRWTRRMRGNGQPGGAADGLPEALPAGGRRRMAPRPPHGEAGHHRT